MPKNLKIIISLAFLLVVIGSTYLFYISNKAEKLGFDGFSQMFEIQKQGYETYADYQNRYIAGGFDSLEEMKKFNSIGIYQKSTFEESGFTFDEYKIFNKFKYGRLYNYNIETKEDFARVTGFDDILKWEFFINNDPYEMTNDELEKLDLENLIILYESTLSSNISISQFNEAIVNSFVCSKDGKKIEFFILNSSLKDKHITTTYYSNGIFQKGRESSILFNETDFEEQFIYDGRNLNTTSTFYEKSDSYWFLGVKPVNSNLFYPMESDYYVSREGDGFAFDLNRALRNSNMLYYDGTCEKTNNQGERFQELWLDFKNRMVNEAISMTPVNQLF